MRVRGVLAAAAACTFLLLIGTSASAATFSVTNGGDSGTGSLRDAITQAEANGNDPTVDLIEFDPSVTAIDLDSGLPSITHPLTIDGPGADLLNIRRHASALTQFRIFGVIPDSGDTVTIKGVTISGVQATGFAGGAVSKSGPGALVLDSVVISGNHASVGPALFYDQGETTISSSTLTDNHSIEGGGAIAAQQHAPGVTGAATIVNSTLQGNSSPGFGGAVFIANGSDITFLSSTIAQNTANDDNNTTGDGGGIYNNLSNVAIANTLLAGNTVGPGAPDDNGQCAGAAVTSSGFNLRSTDDTGCTGFDETSANGDFVDAAAATKLDPLGDNGGPTPTMALQTGNPAIEKGNPDSPVDGLFPTCPTTDQRGVSRTGNNVCDIGAFEKRSPTTTALACSPSSLTLGAGGSTCTATVTDVAGLTTPTGDIAFKTDSDGSFSPSGSCTLSAAAAGSSSCSVTYTPAAIGTHTIGAFFDGTPDLTNSGDSEGVLVGMTPLPVPPAPTSGRAAAIKKCKKKFRKGPRRKRCIKKAKKRFPA